MTTTRCATRWRRCSTCWVSRCARFPSAGSFARFYTSEMPGCLVLDIRMPRQSGLELYEQLLHEGKRLPVIFITAHADVPTAVAAMKTGALEFLEKPFDRHNLLGARAGGDRARRRVAGARGRLHRGRRADRPTQRARARNARPDAGGRIEQVDGGKAVSHGAGRRDAPLVDHEEAGSQLAGGTGRSGRFASHSRRTAAGGAGSCRRGSALAKR